MLHVPDAVHGARLCGCAALELADQGSAFAGAADSLRLAVRPLELHAATQRLRATVCALDRTLAHALPAAAVADGGPGERALLEALWRAARACTGAHLPHAPLVQRLWRACVRGLLARLRTAMAHGDPARLPAPPDLPAFVAPATAAQIAAIAAEMRLLSGGVPKPASPSEEEEEAAAVAAQHKGKDDDDEEDVAVAVAPFGHFSAEMGAGADLQAAYAAMLRETACDVPAGLEHTRAQMLAAAARIDTFLEGSEDADDSDTADADVDATLAALERDVVCERRRVCGAARAALVAARVPAYLATVVGRVALMRAGDLADAFVAALQRLLAAYRGPHWPTLARAQACLAEALRACAPVPFAACVRLRLSARHARAGVAGADAVPFTPLAITCLDFFRLDLGVPCDDESAEVLRAVVPAAVRRRYARVWHFLLRLRWARAALCGTWARFAGARVRALGDARLHTLLLARHATDHFLAALEQYVHTCAVAVPWQRFLAHVTRLANAGDDSGNVLPLTELVRAQDECLQRIETQCFLTAPLRAVRQLLDSVFSCAVHFCAQGTAIIDATLDATAPAAAQDRCLDRALACAGETRAALARHTAVLRELLATLAHDRGHRCAHPRLAFLLDALAFSSSSSS